MTTAAVHCRHVGAWKRRVAAAAAAAAAVVVNPPTLQDATISGSPENAGLENVGQKYRAGI